MIANKPKRTLWHFNHMSFHIDYISDCLLYR